jgi:hypothetical protein
MRFGEGGLISGFCECGNEPFASIILDVCLEHPNNNRFLRENVMFVAVAVKIVTGNCQAGRRMAREMTRLQ